ncbi:FKBP-type peptidyl-prolyl cis-trans isomerase [Sphingomonas sp. LY29]|uniref:FKBP-type peptidyl-prolyl cis-trans isomerase n=1 Tax=unclassified Sphingomonas TaxID=196159 RepID=UPI002ADEF4BC|nr:MULTISPECIES: FKBP-type peptidyl-prolyl cis-trans isomerase [unclassified Sphingomonas]MEA1072240.1 FKBP-type peptidyl-prolyl cis-trans isomerase [Sphingomonas sp. LY160]WRP25089.1 FKBP-type peptidyl-prolyl cis-trans isomerase [Sphingomonas sp. LY29]
MSVTQVPIRPIARGSMLKLWLGIALLAAIALGVAMMGAGRLEVVDVQTIAPGKGPAIGEQDGVIIEYTGRKEDGSVFDSTDGRGPAPLLVGQVVPGFKQGLMRMQQGGRYKIKIPGKLAYGPNPPPGSPFKPNEDLEFDVHVLQVVPNAAEQVAAAQAAQGQLPPQGL